MTDLTATEIIKEVQGRITNLEESIISEDTPQSQKKRLVSRKTSLQGLLSWITERNQTRKEVEPSDQQYIHRAYTAYHKGGTIEMDEGTAKVSRFEEGAYVSAWLWVEKEEV